MTETLYHHGIQGMKWGKRNGPPYPLDYKSHSREEKEKNSRASLSTYENSNRKKTSMTVGALLASFGGGTLATQKYYEGKKNRNGGSND